MASIRKRLSKVWGIEDYVPNDVEAQNPEAKRKSVDSGYFSLRSRPASPRKLHKTLSTTFGYLSKTVRAGTSYLYVDPVEEHAPEWPRLETPDKPRRSPSTISSSRRRLQSPKSKSLKHESHETTLTSPSALDQQAPLLNIQIPSSSLHGDSPTKAPASKASSPAIPAFSRAFHGVELPPVGRKLWPSPTRVAAGQAIFTFDDGSAGLGSANLPSDYSHFDRGSFEDRALPYPTSQSFRVHSPINHSKPSNDDQGYEAEVESETETLDAKNATLGYQPKMSSPSPTAAPRVHFGQTPLSRHVTSPEILPRTTSLPRGVQGTADGKHPLSGISVEHVVTSDACDADVESGPNLTASMGSRVAWDKRRAEREKRYLAISELATEDTQSDEEQLDGRELKRSPAKCLGPIPSQSSVNQQDGKSQPSQTENSYADLTKGSLDTDNSPGIGDAERARDYPTGDFRFYVEAIERAPGNLSTTELAESSQRTDSTGSGLPENPPYQHSILEMHCNLQNRSSTKSTTTSVSPSVHHDEALTQRSVDSNIDLPSQSMNASMGSLPAQVEATMPEDIFQPSAEGAELVRAVTIGSGPLGGYNSSSNESVPRDDDGIDPAMAPPSATYTVEGPFPCLLVRSVPAPEASSVIDALKDQLEINMRFNEPSDMTENSPDLTHTQPRLGNIRPTGDGPLFGPFHTGINPFPPTNIEENESGSAYIEPLAGDSLPSNYFIERLDELRTESASLTQKPISSHNAGLDAPSNKPSPTESLKDPLISISPKNKRASRRAKKARGRGEIPKIFEDKPENAQKTIAKSPSNTAEFTVNQFESPTDSPTAYGGYQLDGENPSVSFAQDAEVIGFGGAGCNDPPNLTLKSGSNAIKSSPHSPRAYQPKKDVGAGDKLSTPSQIPRSISQRCSPNSPLLSPRSKSKKQKKKVQKELETKQDRAISRLVENLKVEDCEHQSSEKYEVGAKEKTYRWRIEPL